MTKEILNLNDDELQFLNHRIGTIELQQGCPVRCITCGNNAEQYSLNMPWGNYMKISDGILEIKAKKKIYLLQEEDKIKKRPLIFLFGQSDPIYYRSFDGKKERTLWDAIEVLLNNHKVSTHLTTAGWRPGDNHMQRAAENIAHSIKHGNEYIHFMYSIKTVSQKTINEYLKIQSKHDTKEKALEDFIQNSNYSHNLIENMKTFKGVKIGYSEQYLNYDWLNEDINPFKYVYYSFLSSPLCSVFNINADIVLSEPYEDIKDLFSLDTIKSITKYCSKQASLDEIKKKYNKSKFHYRAFSGIGRATQLGLKDLDDIGINRLDVNPGKERKKQVIMQDEFSASIKADGTLRIFLGPENSLGKTLVPKPYFETRAEYYKNKDVDKSKYFAMLANLQGKQLLD